MNRKRYSKRVLSLILSVLMIISIIPIGMVQSSAASDTPWLAMYEYQSSDYSKVDNNNVIQLFKGGVLNTNEKKGTYSCTTVNFFNYIIAIVICNLQIKGFNVIFSYFGYRLLGNGVF